MKTVIEMARKSRLDIYGLGCPHDQFIEAVERFAELVRADAIAEEREACVKVAEDSDHVVGGRGYYDQLGDADATVRNIVAAIRSRSSEH